MAEAYPEEQPMKPFYNKTWNEKRSPKQYRVCWPFALQCFNGMWKIHSYSFSVSHKLQNVVTECSNDSVISVPRQSIVLLSCQPHYRFRWGSRQSDMCSGVACVLAVGFEENLTASCFVVQVLNFVGQLSYQTAVILTSVFVYVSVEYLLADASLYNLTRHNRRKILNSFCRC